MTKEKKERIAVISGIRTPFSKGDGPLKQNQADDLGIFAIKALLNEINLDPKKIDEIIIGNVAQPANAANIARVIALKAGLSESIPAYTVHRNCASGMESVSSAALKLRQNEATYIIAGGTESMSNIPFLYSQKMKSFFEGMFKAKKLSQKLQQLATFKLSNLKPVIGLIEGLTDPTCNLIMGLTAENLVREFKISREEQDRYALNSHQKAIKAQNKIAEEIIPVPILPEYKNMLNHDYGPRGEQTLTALKKLRPYFDRQTGTVTVGNACPISDGAAMLMLMTESKAKAEGHSVLGYISDYTYAGLDPKRMGLGPIYASHKLFKKTGVNLKNIDLIEMNEAFAAQIIANERAFASKKFANNYLNEADAIGEIDPNKLNVNGGAIAIGHPVGTSGTRILLTLMKELKRQNKQRGLATLCVGGGQGAAFLVESN
eukprot:COSAG01_NODE_52_length_31456_cov_125.226648_3_plen_432_part_00